MPQIHTYPNQAPSSGDILLGNHIGVTSVFNIHLNPTSSVILATDASGDIKPVGDASSVVRRLIHAGLFSGPAIDDFNAGTLGGAWAWAGAPFMTPTPDLTSNPSVLGIGGMSPGDRAFLYRTTGMNQIRRLRMALSTNTVGDQVGLRIDDGTDNNYVEICLRYNAANSYDLIDNVRTGGGAVTTTSRAVFGPFPIWYWVYSNPTGTFYTNWNIQSAFGIDSPAFLVYGPASGLTWTATRVGIVRSGQGATWQGAFIDWYN